MTLLRRTGRPRPPRPRRPVEAAAPPGADLPRHRDAPAAPRTHARAPSTGRSATGPTTGWSTSTTCPTCPAPLRPFTRFRAADHLGDPRRLASPRTFGRRSTSHGLAADRILLLTCPRVARPRVQPAVGLLLLRHGSGRRRRPVVAVIAEVHNTYGGRHVYVLRPDDAGRDTVDKQFYVSPFLPMGGTYLMRTPLPGRVALSVSIALRQGGRTPFVATLTGRGRPAATAGAIIGRRCAGRCVTLRTAALIRWQGIRLWLRRVPVQPRPADAHLNEHGR